ncbi:hypothetical protein K470DRAFT_258190 [Piedraia hortae CBS 480.64]|uniref:U3 small nucleolar RNA-associated protein 10 n=1 Tax=Piedraia hortae CBS 480.64 TaxID=1314780 RepID=A0A6A7BXY1_9PEZI|nr:hypothetical protein K470DRAFT_258190 [Piedraia hortae CBS 480.64]
MATILQQQLAAIAANSTHQLDLKAQKLRHSKSLIFEPRQAAKQSFDSIYQDCYNGFDQLCALDFRFMPFSHNLFSDQSINEDRTQMTSAENTELNRVVESFMGLVGGRLLLRPALMAVEWLIRRFRVQEYSTESVILAFLPFHTAKIFAALLSILPEHLPATFKWLHPYVVAHQCPPRHVVLSAAINNHDFFSTFNKYVLDLSKAKHQSDVLLRFWAGITAQVVNSHVDSTMSGREVVRKQREEDVLIKLLPMLQSAISISDAPQLYLGSCMALVILAAKIPLSEAVLDALMSSMAHFWARSTLAGGLKSLAMIAEEKMQPDVPKVVTEGFLKADGAVAVMERLSESSRTQKLTLGLIAGCIEPDVLAGYPQALKTALRLLNTGHLPKQQVEILLERVLPKASEAVDRNQNKTEIVRQLHELAKNLTTATAFRAAADRTSLDLTKLTPGVKFETLSALTKDLGSEKKHANAPTMEAVTPQAVNNPPSSKKRPATPEQIDADSVTGQDENGLAKSEELDEFREALHHSKDHAQLLKSVREESEPEIQRPSAKKLRTRKGCAPRKLEADVDKLGLTVRKLEMVLEQVESSKPRADTEMLKQLFLVMEKIPDYKKIVGSDLIYLQSLVLGSLHLVVNCLKEKAVDVPKHIRPDLIVDCIQSTSNTQVHNTGLLLMSSLASWCPDKTIEHVMPLFTFMGSTVLRQHDEYSAKVTDQTVAMVVPPLARSRKKRGQDVVAGVAKLLISFTAAFEHMPLHRRAGLYKHLVQALGATESLFAVVAMLAERYPLDARLLLFLNDLIGAFPLEVQFHAFEKYTDLVSDGLAKKRNLSNVILGFTDKHSEHVDASVNRLLEALTGILKDSSLRKRVAKQFTKGDLEAKQNLRVSYARLLDKLLDLDLRMSSKGSLKHTLDNTFSASLNLLPTKDFIESSTQLMQEGSDATRRQVFLSLVERVDKAKLGDSSLRQTFLNTLQNCTIFVDDRQPVPVRHAAIMCIDKIIEKFGKGHAEEVTEAAKVVAGESALKAQEESLRTVSLLCLSSVVAILDGEALPNLSDVLGTCSSYIEEALQDDKRNDGVVDAGFKFSLAVLDFLPWMMPTSSLNGIIVLAAHTTSLGIGGAASVAISQLHSLAARRLAAEKLFCCVDRTWQKVIDLGVESSMQHLQMLHLAVRHHDKAAILLSSSVLFGVLLKAFDLRRLTANQSPGYSKAIALVNQIAMDMVLKMSDATFGPLFQRFVEWASSGLQAADEDGRSLRLTSLFSFASVFFEDLKSHVTSYANSLMEPAVQVLDTANVDDELLTVLLQALSSSFRHDQDGFWQEPAQFDAISQPLLNQLKRARAVTDADNIIPTITDLAVAAASPEHHKTINGMITPYLRYQSATTRLAAVKCEREITAKLNIDWLALLPEMLPFISELLEDDDEVVEDETHKWIEQIEGVTGVSLRSMLET